jgi:hypothetical protein
MVLIPTWSYELVGRRLMKQQENEMIVLLHQIDYETTDKIEDVCKFEKKPEFYNWWSMDDIYDMFHIDTFDINYIFDIFI